MCKLKSCKIISDNILQIFSLLQPATDLYASPMKVSSLACVKNTGFVITFQKSRIHLKKILENELALTFWSFTLLNCILLLTSEPVSLVLVAFRIILISECCIILYLIHFCYLVSILWSHNFEESSLQHQCTKLSPDLASPTVQWKKKKKKSRVESRKPYQCEHEYVNWNINMC